MKVVDSFFLWLIHFLYMFSILLILERESLDIKKICQISNIVYVQNYVNKYYTGNNIFMLHLLSF